ncbi:MAG: sulfite exporter TauE/SafE family protein [Rhodobacteraceae bacterium]|nr:sulfite exporter TauE/SafE family protein [Paracoccaceae bacterium]
MELVFAGMTPSVAFGLLASSFAGSFIAVALGTGGGVLVLSVMASLLPAAALIPVHGVIQLGSNATRASLLASHISWKPVAAFAGGSLVGVALGGAVVVDLPAWAIQISIGLFVIWSILSKPPKWLSRNPMIIGGFASFLTMFFGATGIFVANFTKSLALGRQAHVATHAVLMTLQHSLKIVTFAVLGFSFVPWLPFIMAMILAGLLGTLVGRHVLIRMDEKMFKRALNFVLGLIALRLIWKGMSHLLGQG